MATRPAPRLVALTERCYRLLLLAYPAEFRRAYGREMSQTFREGCREALQEEGCWGLVRLCGLTMLDLIATSVKEHLQVLVWHLKHLIGKAALVAHLEPALLTAPLRLQVAQHTDIGCKRSTNEDNALTVLPEDPQIRKDKGALFVVADGMGGHTQGDRASELAVNAVREAYYRHEDPNTATALPWAIKHANALVYGENVAHSGTSDPQKGMGTTCIAAVLQGGALTVANVGDSRVYVIHAGQIRQVSQDHSLVARMVREGVITAEQANHHEQRNVIYRSLGTEPEVEVDVFEERVAEGDALVLCTDGLSGLVSDAEILRIVESYEPEESVRQLISRANAAGGPDNITAVVVLVTP